MPIRFFSCTAFIFTVVCNLFALFFFFGDESPIFMSMLSFVNCCVLGATAIAAFLHIFVMNFNLGMSKIALCVITIIVQISIKSWYGWVTLGFMLGVIALTIGQIIIDKNYMHEEEVLSNLRKNNA